MHKAARRNPRPRLLLLEGRTLPAVTHFLALGADAGAEPRVRVLDASTGAVRFDLAAYDVRFLGGVRVAVGDVTGDGVDDLITGAGPTGGPHVRVFDGVSGGVARDWFAYDAGFGGGVNVAAGDVNNDGFADVITAAASTGGPHVRVFDGKSGSVVREFFAYNAAFAGGLSVAAGDVNGDGRDDIITGAGAGGGPHVRAFSGATGKVLADFFAYEAAFGGGVFVAAGDADADGRADIVTGPGATGAPHLRVFQGASGTVLSEFFADFGPGGAAGGARVAAGFSDANGRLDVVAASGPGGGSRVKAYDALTGTLVGDAAAFGPLAGGGGAFVCCPSLPESNVVLDWNDAALSAIRTAKANPPAASRGLAILHVAIENAVNTPLAQLAGASAEVAAAAAAHRVLTTQFPAQAASFDRLLAGCVGLNPDGPGEAASLAAGQQAADAALAARANDGSTATVNYTPTNAPGRWQPTPPANAPFLLPQWGGVTPFALTSGDQFLPPPPPALDSPQWVADFNDVKALGSTNSASRTADQTEIAKFWADGAGTITPPGHWNRIAGQLARARGLTFQETARLFSKLNRALADAAITSWRAKLLYDFWRPVTAIRAADSDGNAATSPDPTWTSLITTPPFPDHTSGHSTFSGAGATVLEGFFGGGASFSTYSDDLVDVSRRFDSFQQAANEAGRSRIFGGIHYESANQAGLASGRAVGLFVLQSA